MNIKKIAGTATIACALGAAALGIGAGTAQADDWGPWVPWVPHVDDFVDWNPWGPGDMAQWCPWHSPPGHWMGGPHGFPCSSVH
jgi:hypothetical protein